MKFGIRLRFALWLLAVLLPVSLAGSYVFGRIEDRVSERVGLDLVSVRQLEAARIESALDLYREHAENLAAGPHVTEFTAAVVAAHGAGQQNDLIGGVDGFAPIDALSDMPLTELAVAIRQKSDAIGSEVAELQIIASDGLVLGVTEGFGWTPYDPQLIGRVLDTGITEFGNAFRNASGESRMGLVVPIVAADGGGDVDGVDGEVLGAIMFENMLGPIVDLVEAHESFGETSEAHLAQLNTQGDAEYITNPRFDRDAAFARVVPAERNMPVNQALRARDGDLIWSGDYRGKQAIVAIQTIEPTGWGLVVKVDQADALSPVLQHTGSLKAVAATGLLAIVFGWAGLLDPVGRRLRKMAEGAERVAAGDYHSPLADPSTDEIGSVASSIDRLATDLAVDIAVRSDVEEQLRRQATRDETTGLFNRQYASGFMRELSEDDIGEQFSLLFLDLDDFKVINDTYGHHVGDEVLAVAAKRLLSVVESPGIVARWGGDEFVVVLPGVDAERAKTVTAAVVSAFDQTMSTSGGTHQVRVSAGASTLRPGEPIDKVLHAADDAMFEQKQARSGRRTVSPDTVRLVERALDADAIEVWYQPIVTGTGDTLSLTGCESLVRIRQRNGALVGPDVFLEEIQRSHLGRAVDEHVLRTALEQTATWIREGWLPPTFTVSVNCGEALLRDRESARFIIGCLEEFELAGHNLMLEITDNSSVVLRLLLEELAAAGVKIAINDLALNRRNTDQLISNGVLTAKLDRQWLPSSNASSCDHTSPQAVGHLVALCQSLGLNVIAEGIETPEQLALMRQLGVSQFQGYLFSHPLPAETFASSYRR